MERWFRSLKSESLVRLIFFGKRSVERAVTEYIEHYHAERNHQGLENELIEPGETTGSENGTIECREGLVDCSSTIIVEPPELRHAIVGSAECLSDPPTYQKTVAVPGPVRCRDSNPEARHRSNSRRTQPLNSCLPKALFLVSVFCPCDVD